MTFKEYIASLGENDDVEGSNLVIYVPLAFAMPRGEFRDVPLDAEGEVEFKALLNENPFNRLKSLGNPEYLMPPEYEHPSLNSILEYKHFMHAVARLLIDQGFEVVDYYGYSENYDHVHTLDAGRADGDGLYAEVMVEFYTEEELWYKIMKKEGRDWSKRESEPIRVKLQKSMPNIYMPSPYEDTGEVVYREEFTSYQGVLDALANVFKRGHFERLIGFKGAEAN